MSGSWLTRTSGLSEQEISGTRLVTHGSTKLVDVKRAIQPTILARRKEEVPDDRREQADRVRDKGSSGDGFHTLPDDEADDSEPEENDGDRDLWCTMDDRQYDAASTEEQKSLQEERFRTQRSLSGRSKSIQEVKKVGALGHWEDECPHGGTRTRRSSAAQRTAQSDTLAHNHHQGGGRRATKEAARVAD